MARTIIKITIIATLVFSIISVATLSHLNSPVSSSSATRRVRIPQGAGIATIAATLQSQKLIRSKWYFALIARQTGLASRIKAGLFDISPNMSTRQIITLISSTTPIPDLSKITVPEGFTTAEIADRIQTTNLCSASEFRDIAARPVHYNIDTRGYDIRKLEGFLYPETYFYDKNTTCIDLAQRMVDQFFKVFTPEKIKNARSLGYSLTEAVTMASLIEDEAQVDRERPIISGVLYNRLKIGMLLQCDATIQYILPQRKHRLLYKDLEVDSPYNTYKYKGLPPGPINNPGRNSLQAAITPSRVPYLYYVARGDGSHIFSTTVTQHNSAKIRIKAMNRQ